MIFWKKLDFELIPGKIPFVVTIDCKNKILCHEEIYLKKDDFSTLPKNFQKLFYHCDINDIFILKSRIKLRFSKPVDSPENVVKDLQKIVKKNFPLKDPIFELKAVDLENTILNNDELLDKIILYVDEKINPGLAGHGGHMKAHNLDKDDKGHYYLHVEFGGGCQGCSQIATTVKDGVEKMLQQEFPIIKGVKDKTNHDQGQNPFYN